MTALAALSRSALALALAGGLAAAPSPAPASGAPGPAAVDPAAGIDLGQGLRYLRVTDLPAGLPVLEAALRAGAVVVDLRRAGEGGDGPARLRAALTGPADPARPVLVLIGAATPPRVRAAIPSAPGLLTVGAASEGITPQVPVGIDPDEDRSACDALAGGASPSSLIDEKVEKARFDEARLARTHANGAADSDGDAAPAADPASGAAGAKPAPLRDRVLQRAVFLHRTLLALGRVPPPPPAAK